MFNNKVISLIKQNKFKIGTVEEALVAWIINLKIVVKLFDLISLIISMQLAFCFLIKEIILVWRRSGLTINESSIKQKCVLKFLAKWNIYGLSYLWIRDKKTSITTILLRISHTYEQVCKCSSKLCQETIQKRKTFITSVGCEMEGKRISDKCSNKRFFHWLWLGNLPNVNREIQSLYFDQVRLLFVRSKVSSFYHMVFSTKACIYYDVYIYILSV